MLTVSMRSRFNPRVLAGGRDSASAAFGSTSMFQSTRPRGRTRLFVERRPIHRYVSIHASSREDATAVPAIRQAPERFQSTRPRGRTRHFTLWKMLWNAVSIHASSREDATNAFKYIWRAGKFQSTRPRGRTRHPVDRIAAVAGVSIHASSREDATPLRLHKAGYRLVSIHASSREDATIRKIIVKIFQGFNPRVLAGGRDRPVFRTQGSYKVSIHAYSREDATHETVSKVF